MESNIYRTTDLSLAAAIRTALSKTPTVHISDRFAEFCFHVSSEEGQRVATAYYADKLAVNARCYAQDIRDLKSLIFQARSGN